MNADLKITIRPEVWDAKAPTNERIYRKMVHNLHLNIETKEQFERRLSEDRIASGEVVS